MRVHNRLPSAGILTLPPIFGSRTLTLALPVRRDSDWMIAVICKRVESDTASGGSAIGRSVRMRPEAEVSTYFALNKKYIW
jgi:hypothetical protein